MAVIIVGLVVYYSPLLTVSKIYEGNYIDLFSEEYMEESIRINKILNEYPLDSLSIFDTIKNQLEGGTITNVNHSSLVKYSKEDGSSYEVEYVSIASKDMENYYNLYMTMEIYYNLLEDYKGEMENIFINVAGRYGLLSAESQMNLEEFFVRYSHLTTISSMSYNEKIDYLVKDWIAVTGFSQSTGEFEWLSYITPHDETLNELNFERDSLYYSFKRYEDEYNVPKQKKESSLFNVDYDDIFSNEDRILVRASGNFESMNENTEDFTYLVNFPAEDKFIGFEGVLDYYLNYYCEREDFPINVKYIFIEMRDSVSHFHNHPSRGYLFSFEDLNNYEIPQNMTNVEIKEFALNCFNDLLFKETDIGYY